MKVKRMGITEILSRIWLFPANQIKTSESGSKEPTQLIVELNSSLRHIIVTQVIQTFDLLQNWLFIIYTTALFERFEIRLEKCKWICKNYNFVSKNIMFVFHK